MLEVHQRIGDKAIMDAMDVQHERRKALEAEVGCSDQQRFIIELEFIQALSNPHYLTWLAQNRYFEDPAFLKYLKYLEYWKQPTYAKYLQYPHCLFFLELLQSPEFCKKLERAQMAEYIHTQQYRFWQNYWTQRMKENAQEDQAQRSS